MLREWQFSCSEQWVLSVTHSKKQTVYKSKCPQSLEPAYTDAHFPIIHLQYTKNNMRGRLKTNMRGRLKIHIRHATPLPMLLAELAPPQIPSPQVFTLFPKLPSELQLMIWDHAAAGRGERHIIITSADEKLESLDTHGDHHVLHKAQAVAVNLPPLLHTCFQSRALALKHYTLSFETSLKHPVYFDYDKDKLVMVGQQAWDSFVWHDLSSEVTGQCDSDHFSKVSQMIGRRCLETYDSK